MASLFNIDISNIRYNGSDILLIKHNGDVIYEKLPLYVPYEFRESEASRIKTMVSTPHTDLSYMFADCNNLVYTNAQDWNTSNVTNMNRMFANCYKLSSIDMSNWDTSKVIDMSGMFVGCTGFYSLLDVSSFNTSNVTNMNGMFSGCYNLTELDVSNFSTGKAINMSYMFRGCSFLTELDVSNWDTGEVINMTQMFSNCQNLALLDVSNWDTGNVTTIDNMFLDCYKLTSLDVSNWDTSSVTSMNGTFAGCDALTTLDLSNWDFTNVTTANGMFYNCSSLYELRLDNCDNKDILAQIISQLPTNNIDGIVSRTVYCKKSVASTASIIMPYGWTISYVYEEPDIPEEPKIEYYIEYTVDNNSSNPLNGGDTDNKYRYGLPRIYIDANNYSYNGYTKIEITKVDGSITTDTSTTCNNISSIRLWYPEEAYAIKFYGSSSYISEVKTIKFYDTPKLKSATAMFNYCNKLTSLNLGNWDISNLYYNNDIAMFFGLNGAPELVNFTAPKNISADFDVSACPKLTYNSLISIIDNLARVQHGLTLGTTNKNKLNTSDINKAKDKGWTVY